MFSNNSIYSPRRQMRMVLIMMVYKFELINEKIKTDQIFESDEINDLFMYRMVFKNTKKVLNEQMTIGQIIEKNYDNFKKTIIKYIRDDGSGNRLNPVTRSILLCASAELGKIDIGIISNEYVDIAKDFIPNKEDYKFVNLVIEKIGKLYEGYKKNERN